MLSDISETSTQPQRMVTLCPSVRVMYIVVESPYGTAMMAKERPRTLSMLRLRGSSDL